MRRGQVTIIVIIGLVLLLVIGLLLLRPAPKPASTQTIQDTAQLSSFVQQCLAQSGEQAAVEAGQQGGYADLNTLKDLPTKDSQVVHIGPQAIPLWHEVQSCPQSTAGCVLDHRPSLCAKDAADQQYCPVPADTTSPDGVSFQESIETLTARKLDGCLANFSSLPTLIVKTTGKPTVRAVISEGKTDLLLDYPMSVSTQDGSSVDLRTFSASLDLKLPQMYRLASSIHQAERQTDFVEQNFLNLLAVYDGIDSVIPPFRDTQYEGSPKHWIRSEVQQDIQQDILPFLDFIQIVNAQESFTPIESPDTSGNYTQYANGIYAYMAIKLDDNVTYPLGATFEYPDAPMYLDINGRELLQPRHMPDPMGMLSLLGIDIYDYRFRYTASFPMVVHVTDPAAFGGRGYRLDFSMEANIANNQPVNTSTQVIPVDFAQTTLDLSDESQLVNHTYTITVKDRHTGRPLPDAKLSYDCGVRFGIGQSDANGAWSGRLPYCLTGGYVIAEESGFVTTGQPLDNAVDDNGRTTVPTVALWPLVQKTVLLYKRNYDDIAAITAAQFSAQSLATDKRSLDINDSVTVTLARHKETPFDDDVPLAGVLRMGNVSPMDFTTAQQALDQAYKNGNISLADYNNATAQIDAAQQLQGNASSMPLVAEVELAPGAYDLSAYLVYNGKFVIPRETRCQGGFLGLFKNCYTLDARNFSQWMSGGAQLNGTKAFQLDENAVYGSGNLTLYALEQDLLTKRTFYCNMTPFDYNESDLDPNPKDSIIANNTICLLDTYENRNNNLAMGAPCSSSASPQSCAQKQMDVLTPYPISWSSLEKYQSVEDYQAYKDKMVRPSTS